METKAVWSKIQQKVDWMISELNGKCPGATGEDGKYNDTNIDLWTSGFWPGILWVMYDVTGMEKYKTEAWNWDEKLEECTLRENDFIHDVGFQFLNTAVSKYMMTGDLEGKRRGLNAANFLAGRFNLAGNFIRAWKWQGDTGWAIIDCAMNLSLLFWASKESEDPRFKHIAVAHANTILNHFIRPDGSVNHVVEFDPETGEFVRSVGGQGYGPESSWSRGQAWAIYGLANTYRYTGDKRYLDASKKVAHYFISSLPEDHVPYWDFRLPAFDHEPRDTAAASIAASGLFELKELVPVEESAVYENAAIKILDSLTEKYSAFDDDSCEGILRGGTGNKPENFHIDVSLIYGDYFYVEAMAKMKCWQRKIY